MGKIERNLQEQKNTKFKKHKHYSKIDRKKAKEVLKEKRARLIIKNLPFKATEENVKEHFGKYGEVLNIDLLKRPDGKLVGCAFIQFKLVQFIKQAQHYTNNQPFLGRNILVDFAKPKDKYKKEKGKQDKSKNEEVKNEDQNDEVKNDILEIKDEVNDDLEEKSQSDSLHSDKDLSESNSDIEGNDASMEDTCSQSGFKSNKNQPYQSHDVKEEKTIFIKNLPFEATNEDLKQCMLQFGPVYYALVCVDKFTEHSKGTAFVKFVNKEDADKALAAGTELTILGNILDCHPAIDHY